MDGLEPRTESSDHGSRVGALQRPADALLARLAIIEGADRTVDAQYYEWHRDAVGYLITTRLLAAADRGVSVRILVDDIKLERSTSTVASLCAHPNVEVRVFNPWNVRSSRGGRGLEFLLRFARLDHRMHNKLLVADGERAVVGGRNLGEEYFGLSDRYNYVDFDVLVEGAAAARLVAVFERYWESPTAVLGAELDPSRDASDLRATRSRIGRELADRGSILSTVLAEEGSWDLAGVPWSSVADHRIQIVADKPGLTSGSRPTQVYRALRTAFDQAEEELIVVAPFFIPSHVEWYRGVIERGVRLRVLTNSLASNPVTISNSGLRQTRAGVVRAGVELHELRTDAAAKPHWETPPRTGRRLSLHAKLYVVDRARVFFGSSNLDPRSKYLNTEMAVSIEDSALAEDRAAAILRFMEPDNAWRVGVRGDGRLVWSCDAATLPRQPALGWAQRLADAIFARLPIRSYV